VISYFKKLDQIHSRDAKLWGVTSAGVQSKHFQAPLMAKLFDQILKI